MRNVCLILGLVAFSLLHNAQSADRSPMHQYLNVTGGFLAVTVESQANTKPVAIFRHYSTAGEVLNEDRQVAQ